MIFVAILYVSVNNDDMLVTLYSIYICIFKTKKNVNLSCIVNLFHQVKIGTQLTFAAGELEFQETILDYPPARLGKYNYSNLNVLIIITWLPIQKMDQHHMLMNTNLV